MRIRPTIRLAIAAPALALGLALAIPAAASATTTTHGAHVIKNAAGASASRPAVNAPLISKFWTFTAPDESGAADTYECDQGFDYTPSNAVILNPVDSVTNNCEYRVYLQYANGTSDCVNPHTTRNIADARFQDPDGVMIGNSKDKC
jgi:hypothetical protein